MKYPYGKEYVGYFKDGQYNGKGVLTKNVPDFYEKKEGNWVNGKLNGFCTSTDTF